MFDPALTQSALYMDQVGKRFVAAIVRLEAQVALFDYVLSPALPVRAFPPESISPFA